MLCGAVCTSSYIRRRIIQFTKDRSLKVQAKKQQQKKKRSSVQPVDRRIIFGEIRSAIFISTKFMPELDHSWQRWGVKMQTMKDM
jgi:hypothetical protein